MGQSEALFSILGLPIKSFFVFFLKYSKSKFSLKTNTLILYEDTEVWGWNLGVGTELAI